MIIGLTGGIASGKSTVAKMIKEWDIPVIDADAVAREVVQVGEPAYVQIIEAFGTDILQEDGTIDRPKLGSIVFNNDVERKRLNAIVHPAIRKRMTERKEAYIKAGRETIVLDIPLLFESNLRHLVDKVIVVYVDEDVQLNRLMERNAFSKEEAEARIASQMPLKDKLSLADSHIDNNGSVTDTKQQMKNLFQDWGII